MVIATPDHSALQTIPSTTGAPGLWVTYRFCTTHSFAPCKLDEQVDAVIQATSHVLRQKRSKAELPAVQLGVGGFRRVPEAGRVLLYGRGAVGDEGMRTIPA